MNRFYCLNVCVIQTVLVFICVAIESVIGQQSKITVWPPKEPEFFDEDNDNIRGLGGRDYPIYGVIPKTSFTCNGQLPGFYADEEAECQVFHLCNNNHKISFLCGNGTVFSQKLFTCNWWYNTTCSESHNFYSLNAELYKVKETKVKANENTNQVPKTFDNNKKSLPLKTNRLPQQNFGQQTIQRPQINSQEVFRPNVGQQAIQRPQTNSQEAIRQSVGQEIVNKPQIVEPVVRHLVLTDNKEPESEGLSEETEPEEYDSVDERIGNIYQFSK